MFSILKMNLILEAADGLGALYLGDIDAATDMKLLEKHNVKAVLTVASGTRITYRKEIVPEHHIIMAEDIESFNLGKFFERGIEFIERVRKNGLNVLVHCFAGVSRSATMTIAYLMKKMKMSLLKAHEFTKSRRRVIYPNNGFKNQLREYEKKLKQLEKEEEGKEQANNKLFLPGQPAATSPFVKTAVNTLQPAQADPGVSTTTAAIGQTGSAQQQIATAPARDPGQYPNPLSITGTNKTGLLTNNKLSSTQPQQRLGAPGYLGAYGPEKKPAPKSDPKGYFPASKAYVGMTSSLPPLGKDQTNFQRITNNTSGGPQQYPRKKLY